MMQTYLVHTYVGTVVCTLDAAHDAPRGTALRSREWAWAWAWLPPGPGPRNEAMAINLNVT